LNTQNPPNPIIDEDPQNNYASLQYTIVKEVVPVKFSKLMLSKTKCNIGVLFQVENEVNVNKYDIEVSTDGTHFQWATSTKATQATQYYTSFSANAIADASTLYVRVKSIDLDGLILTSEVKSISGICKEMSRAIILYPNPINKGQAITIKTTSGAHFNGEYQLTIFDLAGNLVQHKELTVNNSMQFSFEPVHHLAKGYYMMKLYEKELALTYSIKLELL